MRRKPSIDWSRATDLKARPVRKQPADGMNSLERDYLSMLRSQYDAREWAIMFGDVKLRLADRTWYTPDFAIVLIDPDSACGRPFQCHEVKGHMRDDAAVKLKAAAERFQWAEFYLARRDSSGQWHVQWVPARELPNVEPVVWRRVERCTEDDSARGPDTSSKPAKAAP